jgi:YHS domain-containing protein
LHGQRRWRSQYRAEVQRKDDATLNKEEDATMAKDPVCGMNVDEKKAGATAVQKGKTYYFCSAACKAKFEKEPDKYVKN